jgi:tetratricopeptide (TPR) repeat protein
MKLTYFLRFFRLLCGCYPLLKITPLPSPLKLRGEIGGVLLFSIFNLFLSQIAFAAIADSTGIIEIYNDKGKVIGKEAGVFISEDELLTHYYAFSGVDRAKVKAGDNECRIKAITGRNREKKLLKIKTEGRGFKKAVFAKSVKEKQKILINVPEGSPVKGEVISINERIRIALSSEAPKIRGIPVLNEGGEVIGIIEFYTRDKKYAYAIPLAGDITFEDLGALSIKGWREKRTEEYMASEKGKRQTITYLIGLGKYEEALPRLKELIKERPDDKEAYFKLGFCYSELKRYQDALDAYKKYTSLSPDDAVGFYNMGLCYIFTDKPEEALKAFNQAIKINKNHLRAHYNAGILYMSSGKKKEAMKEYKFLKGMKGEEAKGLSERLLEYINKAQEHKAQEHKKE